MGCIINGIQQVGIGVTDAKEVFNWYRKYLGFDILVFEDTATASLMTRYTGHKEEERHAMLAMNMGGGGGLEIWQFKNRIPQPPQGPIQFGDLGINAIKVRSHNIEATYIRLKAMSLKFISGVFKKSHFFFKDPWGNLVQVVSDTYAFASSTFNSGGVMGAIIGVSNMATSLPFYRGLLGYDVVVMDAIGNFNDLPSTFSNTAYRRVLLKHSKRKTGGFGELYGPTQIELFQVLNQKPKKIFKDRLWGDLGFIHLCFDIQGMDSLRERTIRHGAVFTVDSAESFEMGDAGGRFGYMEDPDGTLIELVETHKVPLVKKLGLHINLKRRNPLRPLPKWLVKAMRIHRISRDL